MNNTINQESYLQGKSILALLNKNEIEKIVSISCQKKYSKGETIGLTAKDDIYLCVILHGHIQREHLSENGRKFISEIFSKNQLLITFNNESKSYSGSLVASSNCQLAWLSLTKVLSISENREAIYSEIIKYKEQQLIEMNQLLVCISQCTLKARLAHIFLSLIRRHGYRENNEYKLDLILNQEDLANLTNSTRQNISTIFNSWIRNGWVKKVNRKFVLTDEVNIKREADII